MGASSLYNNEQNKVPKKRQIYTTQLDDLLNVYLGGRQTNCTE